MADLPENLSKSDREIVQSLLDAHGFDGLKPAQQDALQSGILEGGNHLLVAPTGNGKTFCAECLTKQTLDAGGRVAYLVPSQQLVGAKTDELGTWADDYYIAPAWYDDAYQQGDVIVATFDSFFQAMLRDIGGVRGLDRVILDDFHVIYGSFRGTDLEKSIAAILDEGISIFAMSATVGNPYEMADWMRSQPIISDHDRGNSIEEVPIEVNESCTRKDQIAGILREHREKGPFLVFNNSKPKAEARAQTVAAAGAFEEYSEITDASRALEQAVGDDVIITDRLRELSQLLRHGVAYHHADLPREVRTWLEQLYVEGQIGALFCTPTLAYGFDAPVQSVLIDSLQRYTGGGMSYIGVYEYVQWAGRAARPGHGFDQGYAFSLYQNVDEAFDRFYGDRELEDVTSHVSSGSALRWLLLELIELGWTTTEEIEAFLQETLFWKQFSPEQAWGGDGRNKMEVFRQHLGNERDWLVEHGFIEEHPTSPSFETTTFGSAAVAFNFDVRNEFSPRNVYDLATRLEQAEEFTPVTIVDRFAKFVDVGVRITPTGLSAEFDQKCQEHRVNPVAGLLSWYWTQGLHPDEMESRTGVDPTGIRNNARSVADAIEGSTHLFNAIEVNEPKWLEDLSGCLTHGVPRYALPLVENVDQFGRRKMVNLSDELSRYDVQELGYSFDSDYLPERLAELQEYGEPDEFEQAVRAADGIGETISERLRSFAENYSSQSRGQDVLFGEGAVRTDADATPSFARNARLNDFE